MDKKKVVAPLVCHGHSRPVVDLFYSPITPDGFFLVSASKDSSPLLRNGETGDWIGTFMGHKGAVWSCCLDKHALRVATASADFSALCRINHIYTAQKQASNFLRFVYQTSFLFNYFQWLQEVMGCINRDVLHSFEHKHIVRACAFSEDTNLLLTGGMEKVLRIFDLNHPDAPPREIEKSPGSVRTLAWLHSDQTILGSCTDMGGVRLWDVRTGTIVRTLETKSSVTSAEVSQDGRYITTADGSTVKFWDANHFGLLKSYDMPCIVESASLEPKFGNKFIAGGEDMWVHLFDFHTGAEIGCNKGHHGPVHCVRFSPGGESYASGSEDGTIRIWQTSPVDQSEPESSAANGPSQGVKAVVNEVTQQMENALIVDDKTTFDETTTIAN
ncbi:hypothetical protein C2S51_038877 [Perilla frutescens var. frutescens]|nr:hypothetical protein C2S51_038877 [Perilla frutescens var. frutescens]